MFCFVSLNLSLCFLFSVAKSSLLEIQGKHCSWLKVTGATSCRLVASPCSGYQDIRTNKGEERVQLLSVSLGCENGREPRHTALKGPQWAGPVCLYPKSSGQKNQPCLNNVYFEKNAGWWGKERPFKCPSQIRRHQRPEAVRELNLWVSLSSHGNTHL